MAANKPLQRMVRAMRPAAERPSVGSRRYAMPETQLVPHKITKPIQLLAAWLAGLVIINGSFLVGAGSIHEPAWIPTLLAIAAVVNVPLFILGLFLLQTKYRPEMQEDTFYSRYLERKYTAPSQPSPPVDFDVHIRNIAEKIVSEISDVGEDKQEHIVRVLKESEISTLADRFWNNRTLSELYLHSDGWNDVVDRWSDKVDFEYDTLNLLEADLMTMRDDDIRTASLTPLGLEIGKELERRERLWNQKHGRHMNAMTRKKWPTLYGGAC